MSNTDRQINSILDLLNDNTQPQREEQTEPNTMPTWAINEETDELELVNSPNLLTADAAMQINNVAETMENNRSWPTAINAVFIQ